jgi:hypothetical protein
VTGFIVFGALLALGLLGHVYESRRQRRSATTGVVD